MAIMIDDLQFYENEARNMTGYWAHLTSDVSEEELTAFAIKLGMKKGWRQVSNSGIIHYDVKGKTRWNKAIRLGARHVSRAEMLIKAIRKERRLV